MKKRKIWIIIVLISVVITLLSLAYRGTYIGETGWVCGESASEPCYEEMYTWGFPLPYVWDNGWNSVIAQMGDEDIHPYKTPLYFALDVLFYTFLIALFTKVALRKKIF